MKTQDSGTSFCFCTQTVPRIRPAARVRVGTATNDLSRHRLYTDKPNTQVRQRRRYGRKSLGSLYTAASRAHFARITVAARTTKQGLKNSGTRSCSAINSSGWHLDAKSPTSLGRAGTSRKENPRVGEPRDRTRHCRERRKEYEGFRRSGRRAASDCTLVNR